MEKFETFWPELSAHRRDTGEIAAWSREAGDKPKFDWVGAGAEHDPLVDPELVPDPRSGASGS